MPPTIPPDPFIQRLTLTQALIDGALALLACKTNTDTLDVLSDITDAAHHLAAAFLEAPHSPIEHRHVVWVQTATGQLGLAAHHFHCTSEIITEAAQRCQRNPAPPS